jgi:hypothetical protein
MNHWRFFGVLNKRSRKNTGGGRISAKDHPQQEVEMIGKFNEC